MLDLGSASRYRGRDVRLRGSCAAAGVRRADRIIRYDLAAVLRALYTAVPRYYPGTRNSGPVGTCDSLLSQHILYDSTGSLVSIPATHTNASPLLTQQVHGIPQQRAQRPADSIAIRCSLQDLCWSKVWCSVAVHYECDECAEAAIS